MISDYDKFDYNYKTYWNDRRYEDSAERLAIEKLLKGKKGEAFLDIGGSYGRLIPTYYKKFKKPVILDYSLKTLQKNRGIIKKKFPKTELVAANVYAMPFKEGVFDGAMMIRVLHHIDQPSKYFKELFRILREDSVYLQEFANAHHLKASLRAVLKGDFKFFGLKRYQQPTQGNFEGTRGQETTFLNFSYHHIKDELSKNHFKTQKAVGTSFLRVPVLKRLLPFKLMMMLESIAQALLSWANISPSIILKTKVRKEGKLEKIGFNKIEEILCCPKCKESLSFKGNQARCLNCNNTYSKVKGVWDMRINTDEA